MLGLTKHGAVSYCKAAAAAQKLVLSAGANLGTIEARGITPELFNRLEKGQVAVSNQASSLRARADVIKGLMRLGLAKLAKVPGREVDVVMHKLASGFPNAKAVEPTEQDGRIIAGIAAGRNFRKHIPVLFGRHCMPGEGDVMVVKVFVESQLVQKPPHMPTTAQRRRMREDVESMAGIEPDQV